MVLLGSAPTFQAGGTQEAGPPCPISETEIMNKF
jgi:hypothetical protein